MSTMVEGMLPADLLVKIGIYMQSAAHLELAIWRITMFGSGIDPHSNDQFREYLDVKRETTKLLERFRKTALIVPRTLPSASSCWRTKSRRDCQTETSLPMEPSLSKGRTLASPTISGKARSPITAGMRPPSASQTGWLGRQSPRSTGCCARRWT